MYNFFDATMYCIIYLNPIHLKSTQLQSKITQNPPRIIVSYYPQLNPNYSLKLPTILPTQSIKLNLPTILLFRDWLLPPLTEEADFGQHQFQQVASVWVPDQMQLIHDNNACTQTKWLQVKLTWNLLHMNFTIYFSCEFHIDSICMKFMWKNTCEMQVKKLFT